MHDLAAWAKIWGVTVDRSLQTESSEVGFGHRDGQPVVLKVIREPNDEWHSGAVLAAFGGRGTVRAIENAEGAVLLERLDPGTDLVALVKRGADAEATSIIASTIGAMSPDDAPSTAPTVHDWARGFSRYRATGDTQISARLVDAAETVYLHLCTSQRNPRLLHGDLQHYNILFDHERGWLAIDPKGVVGEVEYEIGAAMRNPGELPELLTDPRIIDARLAGFSGALPLDRERALGWTFAQAVLSAIWGVEDGYAVGSDNVALRLASVLHNRL
ncbi:MAG TPA: aminoglycoside phosphotransferase family protein [Gemmatimonadaceae bacterium]|nr:aminoglycoside phosphotransferase family protein [Gemmatimonadaceae bacterium]